MFAYISRSWLFRRWFGEFEPEELKKFVFLGLIFAFVIGTYWALRPLKDGIFGALVIGKGQANVAYGKQFLAWAKIVSLILLFPLVIFYGKAVEKFPRQKMFYFLGGIYFALALGFGLYFQYSPYGLYNLEASPWRLAGWLWYVFVESFGSLMVALFWAFASDTTNPESAKKGFALAVMFGQLGAICGPLLTFLPKWGYFNTAAPVILITAFMMLSIVLLIKLFVSTTPKEQLIGFESKEEKKVEEGHEPGFLEGLWLMLSNKYLLGIFAIIAIFEILATIIDFNFKTTVFATFTDTKDINAYLGNYAVWVNIASFLCLLFGINNIQRYLGVKVSLALMPFIIVGMIGLFLVYSNVAVLFWIMVLVKAVNYALNGPTMKQLYVPTSKDVKYKSQAWIETFGSRSSKAFSSGFNILSARLAPNVFIMLTGVFALSLGGLWFVTALYLGSKFQKAVDEKKVVC